MQMQVPVMRTHVCLTYPSELSTVSAVADWSDMVLLCFMLSRRDRVQLLNCSAIFPVSSSPQAPAAEALSTHAVELLVC